MWVLSHTLSPAARETAHCLLSPGDRSQIPPSQIPALCRGRTPLQTSEALAVNTASSISLTYCPTHALLRGRTASRCWWKSTSSALAGNQTVGYGAELSAKSPAATQPWNLCQSWFCHLCHPACPWQTSELHPATRGGYWCVPGAGP